MAPPKKPAADKPNIGINLDTLEREGAVGPLTVIVKGRPLQLLDARDLDWRVGGLIQQDPVQFFVEAMSAADSEFFLQQKIPGWKVIKLTEVYKEHFGDPGNSPASPA